MVYSFFFLLVVGATFCSVFAANIERWVTTIATLITPTQPTESDEQDGNVIQKKAGFRSDSGLHLVGNEPKVNETSASKQTESASANKSNINKNLTTGNEMSVTGENSSDTGKYAIFVATVLLYVSVPIILIIKLYTMAYHVYQGCSWVQGTLSSPVLNSSIAAAAVTVSGRRFQSLTECGKKEFLQTSLSAICKKNRGMSFDNVKI
ncbi:uncharacterized protein LOC133201643 [Saccostrea echinata]|uniref:uncharacterized protein LOC133201643 n=1 Tax=Saccostrea echinata TaxID=191078 RepID=UPI002A7FA1B2|nr:uncharacterized protein LOC133201643 [Saccostrea echinata]